MAVALVVALEALAVAAVAVAVAVAASVMTGAVEQGSRHLPLQLPGHRAHHCRSQPRRLDHLRRCSDGASHHLAECTRGRYLLRA